MDQHDSESQIVILGNDSDEGSVVHSLGAALGANGVAAETRDGRGRTWINRAVERRAVFVLVTDVGDFAAWVAAARASSSRTRLADEVLAILDSEAYEPLELPPDWRMLVPK